MKNLFPKLTTPYFILTPPYTHESAGVRALHLLCHALNISGQRAYLMFTEMPKTALAVNPVLYTPWVQNEIKSIYSGVDPIVIYPDIVKGNPCDAKKVVRWLLGYPGVCGGETVFQETDKIWTYSSGIGEFMETDRVMCLPVVDPEIFNDSNIAQSGTCYYAKKTTEIWGGKIQEDKAGTKLEGSPQQIANILRRSEKCYIYEDTSVILEAKLCGCPVEYVYGEKFNHVHCERDWDYPYEIIVNNFWQQLDRFIDETQQWK